MVKEIGEVEHFFTDIRVAAIKLKDSLNVGDKIKIKGATTDFEQKIDSIQIDKENVEKAGNGDEIGIKVINRVREGDIVYKLD